MYIAFAYIHMYVHTYINVHMMYISVKNYLTNYMGLNILILLYEPTHTPKYHHIYVNTCVCMYFPQIYVCVSVCMLSVNKCKSKSKKQRNKEARKTTKHKI